MSKLVFSFTVCLLTVTMAESSTAHVKKNYKNDLSAYIFQKFMESETPVSIADSVPKNVKIQFEMTDNMMKKHIKLPEPILMVPFENYSIIISSSVCCYPSKMLDKKKFV